MNGTPGSEEIAAWRVRWTTERVNEVVRLLSEDPVRGVAQIARLPWYLPHEGFASWPERDALLRQYLQSHPPHAVSQREEWVALDLRGITLRNLRAENWLLPFADLSGADFEHVEFRGCTMVHCNLEASSADHASFLECDLTTAKLDHAVWRYAHLHGCKAIHAMAVNAALLFSDVCRTDLGGMRFEGADLSDTTFFHSNLGGTVFFEANLQRAEFVCCNLLGVQMRNAGRTVRVFPSTFFGTLPENGVDCAAGKSFPHYDRQVFGRQRAVVDLESRVESCSQIKLAFEDNGYKSEAAPYYEQESYWDTRLRWEGIGKWRGMWKRGNRYATFRLFIRYVFAEKMIGYGEHPGYILSWALAVMGLFAVIYFVSGFTVEVTPNVRLPYRAADLPLLSSGWWQALGRCLRLSIENFGSINYNITRPQDGLSHTCAALESKIGILFFALLTATWARKAIRD